MLVRDIVFVGSRDRIKKFAMIKRNMKIRPSALVAHAKPADSKRVESMSGNRTPPKDPAQLAMPVAKPRLRLK